MFPNNIDNQSFPQKPLRMTISRIYRIYAPNVHALRGKSYIGQTSLPLKERFRKHKNGSNGLCALYMAIHRYGVDKFIIEELMSFDMDEYTSVCVSSAEYYFIKAFNTIDNGWNNILPISRNTPGIEISCFYDEICGIHKEKQRAKNQRYYAKVKERTKSPVIV